MFKEFGLNNCFTLEGSFHGFFDSERVTHEFTPEKYEEMGASVVNAIYEYVMMQEEEERRKQINKVERMKARIRGG